MACPQNTRQIPINIKTDKKTQYARNLSKFTYDFRNATNITIGQVGGVKGLGSLSFDGINNSYINFSTMGKLRLLTVLFYIDSLNKYNNKKRPMEIILISADNNGDFLLMFIPVIPLFTSNLAF